MDPTPSDAGPTLADLSLADRQALPHDSPLLNAYADQVNAANGLPPGMLNALKNAGETSESTGADSVSPKGATGVMQFIPATAKRFGVTDPTDPLQAINGAGAYAAHISNVLNTDDPQLIAAAYNAGENRPALKAGRIPPIPETQKYVQRVSAYLQNSPPTPAATPPGPTLADLAPADRAAFKPTPAADPNAPPTPADLTPADRATLHAAGAAQYSPLSTNPVENFLAGVGKSFHDVGTGAAQLATDALNYGSNKLVGHDLVPSMDAQVAAENARDAALMHSKAGLAGYFGGSALGAALPAGALTKAGLVTKLAGLASKTPLVGSALGAAVPLAASSAGLSALQPTSAPGERLQNAETGAVLGPLAGGLGAGLGKVGSAIAATPVGTVVKSALNNAGAAVLDSPVGSVLSGLRLVRPSILDQLNAADPAGAAAVRAAGEGGIPVFPSQLRNPGTAVSPGRTAAQYAGVNRAVGRSMGQDTEDVNNMFAKARAQLGANYRGLFDNTTVPLGPDYAQGVQAAGAHNAASLPFFAPNPTLQSAVDNAAAGANLGAIPGTLYQNLRSQYSALAKQLAHETPAAGASATLTGHDAATGASMLLDNLNAQANRVLTPEQQALFRATNAQWRNMNLLQPLMPKNMGADIDPKALARILASKQPNEYVYGQGDQTLPNIARFANTYMGANIPPSAPKGVVGKSAALLKKSATNIIGDVAGGAAIGSQMSDGHTGDANPADSSSGLLSKGLSLLPWLAAAGVAHGGYRAARAAMNPELDLAALNARQGALAQLYRAAQPATAAALTYNAANGAQ